MEKKNLDAVKIKRFDRMSEDLVNLFLKLNAEIKNNSPLSVRFGEDCFHDAKDMTDAFIAYDGVDAIGCTILKKHSKEIGIVTDVYVAPEWRRIGLCCKLLAAAEDAAKKHGYLILIGDTWNELIAMQKAYKKAGFIKYKIVPDGREEKEYYEAGHNYWKLLAEVPIEK